MMQLFPNLSVLFIFIFIEDGYGWYLPSMPKQKWRYANAFMRTYPLFKLRCIYLRHAYWNLE